MTKLEKPRNLSSMQRETSYPVISFILGISSSIANRLFLLTTMQTTAINYKKL